MSIKAPCCFSPLGESGLSVPLNDPVFASTPWNVYPRPQLKRSSFYCLNGFWDLMVRKPIKVKNKPTETQRKKHPILSAFGGVSITSSMSEKNLGKIRVPFPPESRASQILHMTTEEETLFYSRCFTAPAIQKGEHLLLHFGAVDQEADVIINHRFVGNHKGGYLPFSLDITDHVHPGDNQLTVRVKDGMDQDLAWGKQKHEHGGMWYTPISGIWQTVWMEVVPSTYIQNLKLTPDLHSVQIEIQKNIPTSSVYSMTVFTEDEPLTFTFDSDTFLLDIPNPHVWTPEDPYLYNFVLQCGEDVIESYFALRTIEVSLPTQIQKLAPDTELSSDSSTGKDPLTDYPRILLNGKPYFIHGVLDQGYYLDGIYLPQTPDGFTKDILTMKNLGFNALRKHIKIEPQCFYYDCDRLGMLVLQDLVNSGDYSFLLDTALPNLGLQKGIRHTATRSRKLQFEKDSGRTIDLLYNHPSVVYYTIFNEGWGQYDSKRLYETFKKLDPSRIWDTHSGWFEPGSGEHEDTDVISKHVYFKKLKLKAGAKPLILSEFGGYSYRVQNHLFNPEKNYGYRFFEDQEEFQKALNQVYLDEILPLISKGLCGSILTQLSDVEEETNGLITYDREVLKVKVEDLQAIRSRMDQEVKMLNQRSK